METEEKELAGRLEAATSLLERTLNWLEERQSSGEVERISATVEAGKREAELVERLAETERELAELKAAAAHFDAVHVLEQRFDLAVGLQIAFAEDGDAVANVLHVFKAVAAHDDRLALGAQVKDKILHPTGAERIEAGRWLVEDHQLGVVDERLGQADALAHALGIRRNG